MLFPPQGQLVNYLRKNKSRTYTKWIQMNWKASVKNVIFKKNDISVKIEIDPHVYDQLIFNKRCQGNSGINSLFNKQCWNCWIAMNNAIMTFDSCTTYRTQKLTWCGYRPVYMSHIQNYMCKVIQKWCTIWKLAKDLKTSWKKIFRYLLITHEKMLNIICH